MAAIIGATALTACAADSGAVETTAQVQADHRPVGQVEFDFEHQAADLGAIVAKVTNSGIARVSTSVATAGGGRATLADGVGGSYGLRFPAFSEGAPPANAALVVRSSAEPDVFSPGRLDFRFGADFALDRLSAGGAQDNGNNLVQRGLTSDAVQYKIQVDHDVVSCRVATPEGVGFVESPVAVVPRKWYRVSCLRSVDRLVLTVAQWDGTGWDAAEAATIAARTGIVDFETPGPPLAVGAKVDVTGALITSASDQFNGVVDNVRFEIVR